MQRKFRSLTDARRELVQLQQEFTQLQKRIEAVRGSVTNSLVQLFGEERPDFAGLRDEELIERISVRVANRLGTTSKSHAKGEQRYVRDVEAAAFLGLSVFTLRSWRSRGEPCGPPVTRMGNMVMYSVKKLEQYMEQRTASSR